MYLLSMWKILTAQIREGIYYLLVYWRLFPEEQKGNKRNNWPSIYSQRSQSDVKHVAMASISYKKNLWYGPTNVDNRMYLDVQSIWKKKHKLLHWKLEGGIDCRSSNSNRVKNLKRHLPGDSLSQLLFIIARKPLDYVIRKCTMG